MTRRLDPPDRPKSRVWRAAMMALALLGVGCQWVFGDYATVDDQNWGGCRSGDKACVTGTNNLDECKDGGWTTRECAISCTGNRCIDCVAGDRRCSEDTASVEVCNKDGAWVTQRCGENQHCHSTEFVCAVCEQNTCITNGGKAYLSLCSYQYKPAAAEECPETWNKCLTDEDGTGYCVNCDYPGFTCTTEGLLWKCNAGLNTLIRECRNEEECRSAGASCVPKSEAVP